MRPRVAVCFKPTSREKSSYSQTWEVPWQTYPATVPLALANHFADRVTVTSVAASRAPCLCTTVRCPYLWIHRGCRPRKWTQYSLRLLQSRLSRLIWEHYIRRQTCRAQRCWGGLKKKKKVRAERRRRRIQMGTIGIAAPSMSLLFRHLLHFLLLHHLCNNLRHSSRHHLRLLLRRGRPTKLEVTRHHQNRCQVFRCRIQAQVVLQ